LEDIFVFQPFFMETILYEYVFILKNN